MVTRKHFLCACARHPCERKMSILRLQEETQQKRLASFPLLRRPRPPPPRDEPVDAYDGCRETTGQSRRGQSVARGERVEVGAGGTGLQGRLATPLNPLPRHHPTPTSSHRHPFSPSSRLISKNPICEEDNNQLLCSKDITTTDFRGSIGKTNPIRGPPPFPVRKPKTSRSKRRSPKRKSDVKEREVPGIREAVNQELNGEDNEFLPLFSDLGEAEEAALYQSPQRTQLREKFLSRQNYLKLTGWFATHVPTQDTLNTMTLTVDHCVPDGRKPHYQMLLELEAMVATALAAESGEPGMVSQGEGEEEQPPVRWPSPNPGDIVFRSSTSRYFCGEGRSNSPFDSGGQPLISPSEVAILESMLEGGLRLSLKAHFLPSIPPLSPLSHTLSHLNLSFNCLRVFPAELLELTQLKLLRMRNNPIHHLPNDIKRLEKLEDFCISFNMLTTLPPGLFELPSLQSLDVSHNSIQHLPRDISKLRTLQRLNIESNELIGLPPSLLSLPLAHLYISGNYLHPHLWRENCRSPPQALVDMCCTVVHAMAEEGHLPSTVRDILDCRRSPCNEKLCDVCGGPIFGPELKVVKSVTTRNSRFPLTSLPVLYRACSQTCRRRKKTN